MRFRQKSYMEGKMELIIWWKYWLFLVKNGWLYD